MRDLARRVQGGELPTLDEAHALGDAELIERLVTVRGIGRWSAEMFLMFRLGRPDVLPLDDYSLRKAYAKAFGKRTLPSPEALEKHGEKWRPYRTVGELVSVADPGASDGHPSSTDDVGSAFLRSAAADHDVAHIAFKLLSSTDREPEVCFRRPISRDEDAGDRRRRHRAHEWPRSSMLEEQATHAAPVPAEVRTASAPL